MVSLVFQVDEITRNITIVAQQVETIQRNHGVILASFTNKGMES